MKRLLSAGIVCLCVLSLLAGCHGSEASGEAAVFQAEILEISGDGVLVSPLEGESIRGSSDKIMLSRSGLADIGAEVGDTVEITHSGVVMESYPAQISATSWRMLEKRAAEAAAATPAPPAPDADVKAPVIADYASEGVHMMQTCRIAASQVYPSGRRRSPPWN